jgi:general stress protein YciG
MSRSRQRIGRRRLEGGIFMHFDARKANFGTKNCWKTSAATDRERRERAPRKGGAQQLTGDAMHATGV